MSKKFVPRKLAFYVIAFVVLGGVVLGVLSSLSLLAHSGLTGSFSAYTPVVSSPQITVTTIASTTLAVSSSTASGSGDTIVVPNTRAQGSSTYAHLSNSAAPPARQIQFFANLTMTVSSVQNAESRAEALVYSDGGYVAYSSITNGSALAVLRVHASSYQDDLSKIEALGKVGSLTASSNDVTIKLINLNATLQSLVSEKAALVRLMNTTTSVNATLQIESQLQGIDAEINSIETQILDTSRLVAYSTISVIFFKQQVIQKLTLKLTAVPSAGTSPLSATFNAFVTGGLGPYVVNYNFGDGSFNTGQAIIHAFYGSGKYNVTVTATDAAGTTVEGWVLVRVTSSAPPEPDEFSRFSAYVGGLFVSVVEGIVEVGVVTIPIVAVLAVVILPLRKKLLQPQEPRTPTR